MASSSAMDVDKPKLDIDGYLTTATSSAPASLRPYFESFASLHRRKLWHQLTDKLFAFAQEPDSARYRLDVFENFVRDFEGKLNPLRLVEFAVLVSQSFDNPEKHVSFLTSLLTRLPSESSQVPPARVLLLSSRARAKLLYGDLPGTRSDLDDAFKVLDTELSGKGVDTSVHAAYYACAADYHKARAEYGPYYRTALLFLACVDVSSDLTPEDRVVRAHDLALAALLGDSIYNFGELLMHPVLDALDGTQHEWLKKLLFVFNEGAIGKFEALAPQFPKEPILQNNYPFLRQKICLMALIESVFRRDAYDRTLAFSTIAAETRLPAEEVEHLLMKALSLKLIRGTLDQVDEKASITWVQPRVLSREQIGALAGRLDTWCKKLGAVEERVGGGVNGVNVVGVAA